jgi:hypothetical protein
LNFDITTLWTAITATASLVTSGIAFSTLREAKRQREVSYRPLLFINEIEHICLVPLISSIRLSLVKEKELFKGMV